MPERFKVVCTMQGAIQVLSFTFTFTCLENLEMLGILTAVREMSGILLKVTEVSGVNLVREKSPKMFIVRCIFVSL